MKLSFIKQRNIDKRKDNGMLLRCILESFHYTNMTSKAIGQSVKLVTDILRRVAVKSKVKANTLLFDKYDVKDGSRHQR